MNKFGKRLVIALMASSMLATPVYAAPNTDEIKAEKEQKEKEVESVQAQLQTMVSKISETEEKLVSKGEEIQKAKEDLAAAEEKQQQQYESMKVRIKYMYEQGDTKALEDLFTSNSIADFLNQADYIETVHNYDREKLQEYVETTKKIENLKKTLEEDLANLEEMQTSFESQKEQLSQTLAEKQAEVENLDQELQAAIAQAAAEEEARRKPGERRRRKRLQQRRKALPVPIRLPASQVHRETRTAIHPLAHPRGIRHPAVEVLTAEVPAVEVLIVEHLTAEAAHQNRVQVPDPVPAVQADPAQAMQVLQV